MQKIEIIINGTKTDIRNERDYTFYKNSKNM